MITASRATSAQIELLSALIERGPFVVQDIHDKTTFEELLSEGLVTPICLAGKDCYVAATLSGRNLYCMYYNALTLPEAMQARHRKAA